MALAVRVDADELLVAPRDKNSWFHPRLLTVAFYKLITHESTPGAVSAGPLSWRCAIFPQTCLTERAFPAKYLTTFQMPALPCGSFK